MTDKNTAIYFADGLDLEQEREAHRMTTMRWQASREASEALGAELTAAREEAEVTLQADQSKITARDQALDSAADTINALHDEIADLKARLLGMTACAADAARDTQAALAREGVALARARVSDQRLATLEAGIADMHARMEQWRASDDRDMQASLARLAETVTGRPYPEVSAELDDQLAAHPASDPEGDETLVIDDPDAIERVSPDEIAAALKAHREQEHLAGAPFVALGDLVVDMLEVTREIEAIERVPPCDLDAGDEARLLALLERRDTIDRALVRAVAR